MTCPACRGEGVVEDVDTECLEGFIRSGEPKVMGCPECKRVLIPDFEDTVPDWSLVDLEEQTTLY